MCDRGISVRSDVEEKVLTHYGETYECYITSIGGLVYNGGIEEEKRTVRLMPCYSMVREGVMRVYVVESYSCLGQESNEVQGKKWSDKTKETALNANIQMMCNQNKIWPPCTDGKRSCLAMV